MVEVTTLPAGESIRLGGGRKRKFVLAAHVCVIRCVSMCVHYLEYAFVLRQSVCVRVCEREKKAREDARPSKTSPDDDLEPERRFSVVHRRSLEV